MATQGTVYGGPSVGTDPQAQYKYQLAVALARIKTGASWFDWMAILSVVNAVIVMAQGTWGFLVGLGITDLLNALAKAGKISSTMPIIVSVPVAAFFWLMGRLTKQGQKWALILGIAVYVLDALILLKFQVWLSLAFHAYVLFMLARTFSALSLYEQVKQAVNAGGAFVQPR